MAKKEQIPFDITDLNPKKTKVRFTSSTPNINNLTQIQLIALWKKTTPFSHKNQNVFRLDPANALIKLSEFNKKTEFGWVVLPLHLDDFDSNNININSLIPFHWVNAESRLKSVDNYIKTKNKEPNSFVARITKFDDPLFTKNMEKEQTIQNKKLIRPDLSSIYLEHTKNRE